MVEPKPESCSLFGSNINPEDRNTYHYTDSKGKIYCIKCKNEKLEQKIFKETMDYQKELFERHKKK